MVLFLLINMNLFYRWGNFLEKFPENNAIVPRRRFQVSFVNPDLNKTEENAEENVDTDVSDTSDYDFSDSDDTSDVIDKKTQCVKGSNCSATVI